MKLNSTNKILLTLGSLGVAATIAGAGTFAQFTDTEQATQSISAGTVELTAGAASFDDAIADLAPGDTVQKAFTLSNVGSIDFDNITVATADDASGADAQLFDGSPSAAAALQLEIQRCEAGWTTNGTTGLLECAGGAISVLAEQAATGISNVELNGLDLEADDENELVATYRLPSDADNDVQGDSGNLTFTFVATQRDATNS